MSFLVIDRVIQINSDNARYSFVLSSGASILAANQLNWRTEIAGNQKFV